jgi:RNA polymerase sigma-70 factor, ECF subfamily
MLDQKKELFVRLLASHERRLYAYILSLHPNWSDAEDIFQETNVRLWRDFDNFDPTTNFAAWATSIAYYQVLTWRKRVSRNHLVFDDELLQFIAERHEEMIPAAESRHRALGSCLQELSGQSRKLLAQCYTPGAEVKEVAKACGRNPPAVYKALQRIRAALRKCIEQKLRTESTA